MSAFIRKTITFLLIAAAGYVAFTLLALPFILRWAYGPNIKEQLAISFRNAEARNYEVLILGNSRLYCGINPDQFSQTTYNFAHNNDTYNQMFYKLKWVLSKNKKVSSVIVGVDYFQFSIFTDTRNYAYGPLLAPEYMADYPAGRYRLTYYKEMLKPYKLRALVKDPIYKHSLKDNGQFIRLGEPDPGDFIKRNFNRLPVQEKYFQKILDECKQQGIKVYLVMPPLRDVERQQYEPAQVEEFSKYISSFLNDQVVYLDYSTDSQFTISDFIDFSHLGPEGADKFSAMLSVAITE
jgi:hypothetical protein